jgi:hypothetical protein
MDDNYLLILTARLSKWCPIDLLLRMLHSVRKSDITLRPVEDNQSIKPTVDDPISHNCDLRLDTSLQTIPLLKFREQTYISHYCSH